MRYDLKKFLFAGINQDRGLFFEKAQELGVIHFVEIKPRIKEIPADVQSFLSALKILRGLPPLDQEDLDDYSVADPLVEKINSLKQEKDKFEEEQRILGLEIARVASFGEFSMEEVAEIEKATGRKMRFFCAKEGYAEKKGLPENFLYIDTDHGLDYFISLEKEPSALPKMIDLQLKFSASELKEQLQGVETKIHEVEQQLKYQARYNTFLHHALIFKLNSFNLHNAKENVSWEFDQSLFLIEGWVPVNKIAALQSLTESLHVHAEEISPNPNETPPTCLENTGLSRLGEDLVHIYDTPSHTDNDPSLWVLFFFALFFAFIVGDGGYGLIFLGTALFVRYKYSLSKAATRFVNLVMVLGLAILCWGFLTASFFGITPGIDNPIRKVSLIQWLAEKKTAYLIAHKNEEWKEWVDKFPSLKDVTDPHEFLKLGTTETHGKISYDILSKFSDNIMFELAILIGVIHLIISLLRYANRNWAAIGWVLFLVGAYLYFPVFLKVNSIIHFVFGVDREAGAQNGLYLMIGGIGLATVFALYKHRLLGILEPMGVIQLFADSMSYLRLYALGLSGAMLTATMIDLAGSLNFVLGAILLICGHIVNLALSIMGGTIHGLRLNFLEWYHYSFEGGGKPFNPLRKLTID